MMGDPTRHIPVGKPSLTWDEATRLSKVFASGQLTYGPTCQEFESRLAEYLGVKHCLVTSSGTTALHLALLSLGIGPGDEVLVPDITFVATANAVTYTGAVPVLVDVSLTDWCMDYKDAERKITPRTRAIIPVHLYGAQCGHPIAVGNRFNLSVIEDAAEGLGGHLNGNPLGTIGDCGVFSFYANKIMTTVEGGAVVTNDSTLANRIHHLRGQAMDPSRRYYHTSIGYNYRMTELQAAIGLGQLSRLDTMLASRREIFKRYRDNLNETMVEWVDRSGAAPWLFTILLPSKVNRDQVMSLLSDRGIETRPVFVPLHQLPMYSAGHSDSEFPAATNISRRGLSLPTYADLALSDVDYVCNCLINILSEVQS